MTLTRTTSLLLSLLLSCNSVFASCTKSGVERILSRDGFSFEFSSEEDGSFGYILSKDGGKSLLIIDGDDGDISLRDFISGGEMFSYSDLNRVNQKLKYIKAYFNPRDDSVVLEMDVPHWGNGCHDSLSKVISTWFNLLEAVDRNLQENL